jgi:hypothetical protein
MLFLPSSIDGDAGPTREDSPSSYPLLARPVRAWRTGAFVVADGLMAYSAIGVILS